MTRDAAHVPGLGPENPPNADRFVRQVASAVQRSKAAFAYAPPELSTPVAPTGPLTGDARPAALPGLRIDPSKSLHSWSQLFAFLQEVRAKEPQPSRPITLVLVPHRDDAAAFELVKVNPDGSEQVSMATASWIRQKVHDAGFAPGELLIPGMSPEPAAAVTHTVGRSTLPVDEAGEKRANPVAPIVPWSVTGQHAAEGAVTGGQTDVPGTAVIGRLLVTDARKRVTFKGPATHGNILGSAEEADRQRYTVVQQAARLVLSINAIKPGFGPR